MTSSPCILWFSLCLFSTAWDLFLWSCPLVLLCSFACLLWSACQCPFGWIWPWLCHFAWWCLFYCAGGSSTVYRPKVCHSQNTWSAWCWWSYPHKIDAGGDHFSCTVNRGVLLTNVPISNLETTVQSLDSLTGPCLHSSDSRLDIFSVSVSTGHQLHHAVVWVAKGGQLAGVVGRWNVTIAQIYSAGTMCLTRDILLEVREYTGQATFIEVTQYKGGGVRWCWGQSVD